MAFFISAQANFRVSTLSHHMGRCVSSFLNYALQNKLQIEKGLQIGPSVQSDAQQSPGSAISNSNDDCYDPSADQHFGSIMMVPPHQLHNRRQLHHDPDESEARSDSIYERLPEEQARVEQIKAGVAYQHGLPSSLVRQPRGQGKHVHTFGSGLIEPEDEVEEDTSTFFTPVYEGNPDEQLVKPSQIKQLRRLNCKCNLLLLRLPFLEHVRSVQVYLCFSSYNPIYSNGVILFSFSSVLSLLLLIFLSSVCVVIVKLFIISI